MKKVCYKIPHVVGCDKEKNIVKKGIISLSMVIN